MSAASCLDGSNREISSNVTHSGDIDAMQHIRFTALRIAVVTCKSGHGNNNAYPFDDSPECPQKPMVTNGHADFAGDLLHLLMVHGKTRQDLVDLLPYLSPLS